MQKAIVQSFLEAFAVGDAFGKVTEYCSREQIMKRYSSIVTLLTPEESLAHGDLFHGQVTDDTEQNIYLIREYAKKNSITAQGTALALLRWVQETDARKYIGPNSLKALQAIHAGEDINTAGVTGTTCGGMMRVPAAFLFSTTETLEANVVSCLTPTHNTSVAMEAAMCYAFALNAAMKGFSLEEILQEARKGAQRGKQYGSTRRVAGVAPSCAQRIAYLQKIIPSLPGAEAVKAFLYDIIGATLASCDVCACTFGLFIYAKKDVALAIRLATEMGGDTDTIACLAAGLCTLYAQGHNLPRKMVQLVETANRLSFSGLAQLVVDYHSMKEG